jgi:hypothetical protein
MAGLEAKPCKPPVGNPFGKPPPGLGTFGTAGKVWAKVETQMLAKTQKRKKDLRGIGWLKISNYTFQ